MEHKHITFIGGGNMASALLRGLMTANYPHDYITVYDINYEKASALAKELQVQCAKELAPAIANADIILLAVKPNAIAAVCQDIKPSVKSHTAIISVAAGVPLATIARLLQNEALAMIRVMPNTPALIGSGATGLYANAHTAHAIRQWAESLFRAVGIIHWCDKEESLDAITALSGSGPAYIFLVMEAMQEAAVSLGLDEELAKTFTIQTVLGASRIALETKHSLVELRQQVTSPGGTTEKGLEVLTQGHLKELFARTLAAACEQAKVLSKQYDQ